MTDDLRTQFRRQIERVNALSLRERGILFMAIMAVLYAVTANFLLPPLFAEQDKLKKQVVEKRKQIQSFDIQIQAALAQSANDPDAPNRARLVELEKHAKMLDESLAAVTSRLVSPKEMVRVMEQILTRNNRLQIVKIVSLAPEPLAATPGSKPSAGQDLKAYRQGMRIELRGGYLDTLAYLREVENLPWKVFWGQISLQTEQYPVSRVVLHIYTLSTQEKWMSL